MIHPTHAARIDSITHALLNQPEALATVAELVSEAYRLGMRAGQGEMSAAGQVDGMMQKINTRSAQAVQGRN